MIKAFLFDYDGVITRGVENTWAYQKLSENLDVPLEQAAEWLKEVWRPYMKGADIWAKVERKYGKPIAKSKRNIWFTWNELEPLPEMIALVNSLKAHGFAVGCVSNIFKESVAIIEEHDGYDPFDFRVVSCEVGYAKPEAEIFQIALSKLGDVSPREVVFLDDHEKNVVAANELGMLGVYVTNHIDAIRKVKELAGIENSSV